MEWTVRRSGALAAGAVLMFVGFAGACSNAQTVAVVTPGGQRPALATAPAATAAPVTTVAATTSTAASTTTARATTTVTTARPTTTTVAPTTTTTTIAKVQPLAAPLVPLRAGARGDEVLALQNRLLDLGFWMDDPDGQYATVTTQAVMAFQKYVGGLFNLKVTGQADQATVDALGVVDTRAHGYSVQGDLIEIDKARQLMFLVRGGRTIWTFNTSTGSGETYTEPDLKKRDGSMLTDVAITPEGIFKVYNEYTEGWEKGQLGELYRPKYFKGGVAVHGSNSIPSFPASHGCVRLTTTAMDWIWANDLMPKGSEVWVHNGGA